MIELDGFHLTLIYSEDDSPIHHADFQTELKGLVDPLSDNECEIYHSNFSKLEPKARLSIPVFIPLKRATDPSVWEAITNWVSAQPGRTLKLRYRNLEGEAQTMEQIVPILERTLKTLTNLVEQGPAFREI
ncbi:hypothetical protein DMX03_16730 [Pseudomonas koreensis]|nr:hypothetical protein DMX03_16730 [Pseudomonas koreensis]PYB97910.1 hypothetical protein DMX04_20065 [Pseudomonas koreensis]